MSEAASKQISKTHMDMLMESVLDCSSQAEQSYNMQIQAAGDVNIGELGVDMSAV